MKKHVYELDFIRAICALGIIAYHFSNYSLSSFKPFYKFANGDFGALTVTVFFIITGYALYLSNSEVGNIKRFYYKRFKSIFPTFWLVWLIFYIKDVIKVRYPFYAGNPLKFLLTLIGQDGYFSQRIITYYEVGEWFLGALIFVYLLYPLLVKFINKKPFALLIVLVVLYEIIIVFKVPVISPGFPGIIESCLKVYIGMLLAKYLVLETKELIVPSVLLLIPYLFIDIPISQETGIVSILLGTSLFIVLYNLATLLFKIKYIKNISTFIGSITFEMFLFQHKVILIVKDLIVTSTIINSIINLIVCIVVTIILAYLINTIMKYIKKTKIFTYLDKKYIGD